MSTSFSPEDRHLNAQQNFRFSTNGLFVLLLKYPLQEDFFKAVKHVMQAHAKGRSTNQGVQQSLRETIFSDTFRRLAERPDDSPDPILPNLKAFVELVYCEGYSAELMHGEISTIRMADAIG